MSYYQVRPGCFSAGCISILPPETGVKTNVNLIQINIRSRTSLYGKRQANLSGAIRMHTQDLKEDKTMGERIGITVLVLTGLMFGLIFLANLIA